MRTHSAISPKTQIPSCAASRSLCVALFISGWGWGFGARLLYSYLSLTFGMKQWQIQNFDNMYQLSWATMRNGLKNEHEKKPAALFLFPFKEFPLSRNKISITIDHLLWEPDDHWQDGYDSNMSKTYFIHEFIFILWLS